MIGGVDGGCCADGESHAGPERLERSARGGMPSGCMSFRASDGAPTPAEQMCGFVQIPSDAPVKCCTWVIRCCFPPAELSPPRKSQIYKNRSFICPEIATTRGRHTPCPSGDERLLARTFCAAVSLRRLTDGRPTCKR